MAKIAQLLTTLAKDLRVQSINAGFVIGKDWIEKSKTEIKKILIASRLTRKVVATTIKNNVEVIVTIYPTSFTINNRNPLPAEKLDLLEKIIENRLAVFSLEESWLTANNGGFDYILQMLDFSYFSRYKLEILSELKSKFYFGRIGERENPLKFKELVDLTARTIDATITYSGYHNTQISKIVVFNKLNHEEMIYELVNRRDFDALLIGEANHQVKNALTLTKIPTIILGGENLENQLLGKIRRILMEYITLDLPELISVKQSPFGREHSV